MWIPAFEPRRLARRLVCGRPHTPGPPVLKGDQRSTGLAAVPPTSALAGYMFRRGFGHRFGFPLHGGLAHRTDHGGGSPHASGFNGFC